MAENEFKNMLFAFVLMSLFGILIISFSMEMANNYGKSTTDVLDGSLNLTKFNQSITNIEQTSQNTYEKFTEGNIFSAIAGLVYNGIFTVAKSLFDIIIMPFDIVSNIMIDLFGIPTYVTGVIFALLIMGIIFAIWRLLAIGN
jgi:hypothetical protein